MISEEFRKALSLVMYRLNKSDLPFMLIGSTNLVVQGMDKKPNDIDISVHFDTLKIIEKIFETELTHKTEQYKTVTKEPAWHVGAKINGIEVEFVGEQEDGIYWKKFIANNFVIIQLDGVDIHCLTLEGEIKANEEKGKTQKAQEIREFVRKKHD